MTEPAEAPRTPERDAGPVELSVVVVHYRVPDLLLRALRHLGRAVPGAEVILVDTDPDREVLRRAREAHPGLRTLAAVNHSYAAAANAGLKLARGRFLAPMNPDVFVEPDTFERLLAALDARPRAGVAAPLARTPRGRRQDHGPLYHPHYLRLALRPGGSVRVPWVPGLLHVLRREALMAVGGYDASLRFYNEDMDLCRRLRAAGYHALLVDAPVLHLSGSSTPSSGAFLVEGVRGGYQLSRRYLPPPLRRLHRQALRLGGAAAAAVASLPERRRAFQAIAAMARDGTFDEPPFGDTLAEVSGTAPGSAGSPTARGAGAVEGHGRGEQAGATEDAGTGGRA